MAPPSGAGANRLLNHAAEGDLSAVNDRLRETWKCRREVLHSLRDAPLSGSLPPCEINTGIPRTQISCSPNRKCDVSFMESTL